MDIIPPIVLDLVSLYPAVLSMKKGKMDPMQEGEKVLMWGTILPES